MSIRLGYQIPNFTYPGRHAADIAPTVVAQAREAERAGFDAVLVMDHFYQLPGIGEPDEPMLEAYTLLGALATATERVQLSALVTGNTYRNPTHLAKAVTTLDVVSGGRAVLGIGAGWYELEHRQLGFEFGTFADRFDRLAESLEIVVPMLRGERPTVRGTWYSTESAMNEPRLRDDLPVLVGGSGERKTFRLAARYADHLNIICNATDLPRKLDALAQRCEDEGRDRATLETSYLAFVIVDEDGDAARRMQYDHLRSRGVDLDTLDDDARALATERQFVGTPDDVAEQLQRRVLDRGVDGIILNLVPNGHVPGVVDLAGRTVRPLVGPTPA
ncbi:5,10-methylenetetrahydromethanopterin reductase [Nostocoides japonicum T1-X7]|uniref:5,10-methylenetetrahydromethanopterin reductase n=1 Tax=Nostocoides japonicum T1-X7 TaxID=1194083 RepID=A0A077M1E0_9MICO|nr:LLM class F420-dependent oxidoreductase [Tetrasphaera japonica]CCH78015.1 5,10-methylenetetrahydromethanopterin reductase [Tetrasphaera japonica T1-X7]